MYFINCRKIYTNAFVNYAFLFTLLVIVETPSTNCVLKRTLALLNIPSFKDTMINCEITNQY
jgi:hypothetical protein